MEFWNSGAWVDALKVASIVLVYVVSASWLIDICCRCAERHWPRETPTAARVPSPRHAEAHGRRPAVSRVSDVRARIARHHAERAIGR